MSPSGGSRGPTSDLMNNTSTSTPSRSPPNQRAGPVYEKSSPSTSSVGAARRPLDGVAEPTRSNAAVTRDPTSPPTSPEMLQHSTPPGAPAATIRSADALAFMPRNPSIDSNGSSTSSFSAAQRLNGTNAYRVPVEPSSAQDVAALIAAAGSAEAAVQKLIGEKNQAASHNAQLWRLVEKQRAMILGLNKDLEKSLKEKERYRKKFKDQLSLSEAAPSAPGLASLEREARDDSRSPMIPSDRTTPTDPPTASEGTANLASSAMSQSSSYARGTGRPEVSGTAQDARRLPPTTVPPIDTAATPTSSQRHSPQGAERQMHMGPNSAASPSTSGAGFSSPKSASRKAPPAPLQLAPSARRQEMQPITNNIIDPSDSEYEEDPVSARAEQLQRGRRKTREEDDEDREEVVRKDLEARSRSLNDKKIMSKPPVGTSEPPAGLADPRQMDSTVEAPQAVHFTLENGVKAGLYSREYDPTMAPPQRPRPDVAGGLPKSSTAPSLLSPGLPMSPRPGDRPMNSPMPRTPALNSMSGAKSFPLSPRAPRQPIPLPPQTPLGFASPHLARAEAYQTAQLPQLPPQAGSATKPALDQERSSTSSDPTLLGGGDVYKGFMTEQYPSLILPPSALALVYVKTASSRMKPSRMSYIAPRPGDENPVFTLAVHEGSDHRALWRVEKTFAALAALDQHIKSVCTFRERLPDKTLFTGHAPAKIDARRSALDTYIGRMMEAIVDEQSALVVCKFLSTDAFGPAENDNLAPIMADPRADTPVIKQQRPYREGYLTKRGKNFGGWKARYFVLDGPNLKYFDDRGGAQLGAIKLQNAQIGKQSNKDQNPQEDEDNQFRHAFLILEPKKKDSSSLMRHVLCAENDEERDSWVGALLQYVDYKDEEGDSFARGGGVQITKNGDISVLNAPRSPRLQKSLNDLRPPSRNAKDKDPQPSDHLRAVGYNDTVAGDAPIMGNLPARKTDTPSPTPEAHLHNALDNNSSAFPTISGPTNMQAIPNDWGMKSPQTPHGKDKKRGLFSQLRGRSSSDLNDKTASPGFSPHDHGGSGSVRAVFGVPLAEAVELARPLHAVTELPAVVYRCIEYLEAKNAVAEEGIFRLSGSNTVIKGLKDRFNTEGDVNLTGEAKFYDVHAVASLLKLYLRELPASILTRDLHLEFLQCLEIQGRGKIVALNGLVIRLPTPNYALLQTLSSFLASIVNNADVNKMNIRNVGIVFAPTLNVPAPLISAFVEKHADIFGPPLAAPDSSAPAQEPSYSAATSTDLRSPRKQMFQNLPTPAYNHTTFQSLDNPRGDDATGMIPVHPTYAPFRMAPQGDGGYGSLNDALRSPAVYSTAANGVPTARDVKASRRESTLGAAAAVPGLHKKSSLSFLREEDGAHY